ncbi:hypothetical protein [Streptomyces sp. V1I1]|uniref:hypothetical protein n=1 Tax=Streptomyces sp. V1I1 TaxID=3042272 RepID=UPI0027D7F866|nr:hypothetical protein [Streptomyces sp. V1I1]
MIAAPVDPGSAVLARLYPSSAAGTYFAVGEKSVSAKTSPANAWGPSARTTEQCPKGFFQVGAPEPLLSCASEQ